MENVNKETGPLNYIIYAALIILAIYIITQLMEYVLIIPVVYIFAKLFLFPFKVGCAVMRACNKYADEQ